MARRKRCAYSANSSRHATRADYDKFILPTRVGILLRKTDKHRRHKPSKLGDDVCP